jgi:hypothetical protein
LDYDEGESSTASTRLMQRRKISYDDDWVDSVSRSL